MATIGQAADRIRKDGQASAKRAGVTASPASPYAGEAWSRATAAQTAVPESRQTERKAAAGLAADAVRGMVGGMGVSSIALPAAKTQSSAGQSWAAGLTGQERQEKRETVRQQLDALNKQALDPAVHQNPTRMNQLNQEMKRLRASVGEQTLGDRVESGLGAAAASVGAGYANLAGLADSTVHDADYNRRQIAAMQKALETGRLSDGKPVTSGIRKNLKDSIARMEAEISRWEAPDSFQSRAYQAADRAAESSARLTAEAKEGLGKAGQLAVDVGIAGAQMGGDALIAALTGGSSLVPMAVRAAGGAAQEARLAGAGLGQQWAYGLGSAALSVGTEKISNIAAPFRKMFGAGAAEKIAGKLAKRFGENQAVRLMTDLSKTAAGRIALSAIGEGGEEVVEDVLQPFLQRATYDKDARFDAGEAGHDFLVGAILGTLGGVPEAVAGRNAGNARMVQNQAETGTGAARAAGGDMDVSAATAQAQGLQKSENGTQETMNGPETADQGGLRAGGGTIDVMAQEARRLYGDKKAASPGGETAREYHGQIIDTIRVNLDKVQGMRSVAQLTGGEFQKTAGDNRNLRQKVIDFFNSIGNKVHRPDMGDIELNAAGARSSVAHGYGKLKAATFAALPSVLEHGRIIEVKAPYEGHEYESFLISAPVDVNGITCYVGALVIKDPNVQRYKLHEVLTTDENGVPLFKSETGGNSDRRLRSDTPLDDALLDGEGPGKKPLSFGVSSSASSGDTSASSADSTIAQGAVSVKSRTDPLLQAILGDKQRVDQAALSPEQFDRAVELNEQGAVGMDAAGKVYQVDPAEHIDRREMGDVGSRKVNAFQFDHPELHDYYITAAQVLDAELGAYIPGGETVSKVSEDGYPYSYRLKRTATPRIAELIDDYGINPAQIGDALEAIIHNHGQENYAAAKRLELMLDDMLSNGYTDAMTGDFVAPNQDYIRDKGRIAGSLSGETGLGADGLGAADAGSLNSDYDRLQAQSSEFHPVNESSARRIMEEQQRAPSEIPVVNPETGKNVTKTVSTILNSPLTSPEMAVEIENAVADGRFDYIPVTDRSAVQRAQADISNRGLKTVADEFITKVDLGQRITKNDIAAATECYNQAVAAGDKETVYNLTVSMADVAHDGAQMLQAMNLMNRLTPEGRLLTLRRYVDKLNRQADARAPGKSRQGAPVDQDAARADFVEQATGFRISDELAAEYLMAETDAERAAAWDAITTNLAEQIPSTFMDKANFLRYTSMLLNPTTHVRNFVGNGIQAGARSIKNLVGAAIERAVIKDRTQRTKSVLTGKEGKALKAFARRQYDTDQDAAMGAGKYTDGSAAGIEREIQSKKKTFKGSNPLSKGVQAVGDFNSSLLDLGDVVFNRPAYVNSFAQALKAKGVTAAEAAGGAKADLVSQARAYAIEEARRATYRNTTALSETLSKLGRYNPNANKVEKGLRFAADAFLPFRRTPANILTTGMDYSPLGIAKAVKQGLKDLKRGDCTAADVVDSLSAGLTGTGIMALGMYLAAEGILRYGTGDDDREEDYNEDRGRQKYSVQIGDKSYTLDWAVPVAMPLYAGASIMSSGENDMSGLDAVLDALGGISEVVLETSMLSSLNDLISNWSYADNKALYLLDRAAAGYLGQYVPTVGGKIASAMDDTVRKSYVEKNRGQLASDVDYFRQNMQKKIPGARDKLQPKIDLWGQEVSNGTAGGRFLQNFLSPGYGKTMDTGALDTELRRLSEAVGSSSVYPSEASKSFTLKDKRTKYLTGEEYTKYAKQVGQTRKQILDNLINREGYQAMNDEDKAYVVGMVYDYATKTAQRALVGGQVETAKWILEAMQSPLDAATVILYKARANQLEDNEKVRQEIFRDGSLSTKEKNRLDDILLRDGFYIEQNKNVDYSDRDSFLVTQMSDGAVKHWDGVRAAMPGMDAETYGTAWEIFNRKGTKGNPYSKERKIRDLQNELGLSWQDAAKLYGLMGEEISK